MKNNSDIKIFSGSASRIFTQRICSYLGIEMGKSYYQVFPEGNIFCRIDETIRGKDIFIIQSIGFEPNNSFMELCFWIDAAKRASANSITAVIPQFGYSKSDKKDQPRVSIRAKICAEFLELAGANRVLTMDLHSEPVQGFFRIPVDELKSYSVYKAFLKKLNMENLVVVSPDAGSMKRARELMLSLNSSVAVVDKGRNDNHDGNVNLFNLIGDVAHKNTLIFDDFSITGNSLFEVAVLLKNHSAENIYSCITHCLLNADGVCRINNSNIKWLYVTDTVENNFIKNSEKIKVISVAPLFAEAILKIHNKKSLGDFLKNIPDKVIEQSII